MKIKYTSFLLIFSILIMTSSCSRYYYSPDEGHLLTISQKNDFHISTSLQTLRIKDTSNQVNIQLGYSPIKHLAIQGSYFYLSDADQDDILIKGRGHMGSGAIGGYYFFKPIPNPLLRIFQRKNKTKNLDPPPIFSNNYIKRGSLIDLYFGHARGNSSLDYNSRGNSIVEFQKTYGQIGFHWFNRISGFSYTFKMGQLQFDKAASFGIVDLNDISRLEILEAKNDFFIRESSFRLFTGIKQARCFFNLTILSSPNQLEAVGVDNYNFTIGAIVDIDECFRKK